jgi:predicted DNA-binding protein YlxM (UPF0122 family)
MKKIITLTESDLTRIVKRIINEKKDNLPNDLSLNDLKKYLDVYSDRLTGRENEIVRSFYLENKTLEDISKKLGISTERIKLIRDNGVRRVIRFRDTQTDHLGDRERKIIKMEILDGDVRTLIDKFSKDLSREEIYKTIRKVLTQY